MSKEEADLLKVAHGEYSAQAVLEAYAILRAIDLWGARLQGQPILVRSDPSVALSILKKFGSPHPTLNYLASKMVLRLEKFRINHLVLHRLKGALNRETDWLSRIGERQGKEKPPGLSGVTIGRVPAWHEDPRGSPSTSSVWSYPSSWAFYFGVNVARGYAKWRGRGASGHKEF